MDAGKTAAVGSGSMTPASTPVRRGASVEANGKSSQTSRVVAEGTDGGDTVQLSSQGKHMANLMARQAKTSEGDAQSLRNGALESPSAEEMTQSKAMIQEAQAKVLEQLRQKEMAAIEGKGELTDYEKNRMAKLDQIQLLIDQGKYQVDNFIVDRVAVELARMMV
ncbi:MAG: hypothetical protein RL318_2138 [Fibrobacterota bacterium]|jgi:multidrug efflux pump subunit AcrB